MIIKKKLNKGGVQSFVNELIRLKITPGRDKTTGLNYFDWLENCDILAFSLLIYIFFLHFSILSIYNKLR